MAVPPQTVAAIQVAVDSLVYNPGRNFITAADYTTYIQQAALQTAMQLGGIRYIDTTVTTVAGQRDYALNNQYKAIVQAWYIKNFNTPTETVAPLEVVTLKDIDFLGRVSAPGSVLDTNNMYITGIATDTPKYIVFLHELNTIRLLDTPNRTGDTLRLHTIGVPASMSAMATPAYDGDSLEFMAIVYKVCALARLKSRETQESGYFENLFQQACDEVRRTRSKERRVRQVQDGRFFFQRLRSVNGAK